MKLRIEVAKNKSLGWAWAVRTMKKFKTHAVVQEDGLEVHAIDFADVGEFAAVFSIVGNWKMCNVYQDGRLLSKADAYRIYWKERQKDHALDDLTRALRASAADARRRPPEE